MAVVDGFKEMFNLLETLDQPDDPDACRVEKDAMEVVDFDYDNPSTTFVSMKE